VAEFGHQGFAWAASGEAVLANTLRRAGRNYNRPRDLYRLWRDDSGVTLCFRDDRLSDLIGFEYSRWDAYDAARNFVAELGAIRAATPPGETPLVCVALDGENAWEYYPYNGFYFFEALYTELAKTAVIRTTTFEQVLHDRFHNRRREALPTLCAGSWVHGTLTIWIGEPDKNRAWDLLCAAKQCFDKHAPGASPEARARAEELLYACEGSDWFWWLGDYNAAVSVMNFEQLLRSNLRALYAVLGVPAPAALNEPISHGSSDGADAGTMRRAGGT
jgi:alpha-amylase/alpha-mannosidase (GH57 family)